MSLILNSSDFTLPINFRSTNYGVGLTESLYIMYKVVLRWQTIEMVTIINHIVVRVCEDVRVFSSSTSKV